MKFKKGDEVRIIAGKDKGKQGVIARMLPREEKIVVEGVNVRKKHLRSRNAGEPGTRVEISAPFTASKAMLVCPHTGKPTRIGFSIVNGEKTRISKRAGKPLV